MIRKSGLLRRISDFYESGKPASFIEAVRLSFDWICSLVQRQFTGPRVYPLWQ